MKTINVSNMNRENGLGRTNNSMLRAFNGNQKGKAADRVEEKRVMAKKQANQIIKEQFAKHSVVTDGIKARTEKIVSLQEENESLNKDLQAALEEGEYELARCYRREMEENKEKIMGHSQDIKGMKRGLIGDRSASIAQEQAEEILEAASKEIVGMLMEDAKNHIDEKLDELIKLAKEAAEKKEEEEEKLENMQEKAEAQEELIQEIREAAVASDALIKETAQIMQGVEPLVDELKGILVDEGI